MRPYAFTPTEQQWATRSASHPPVPPLEDCGRGDRTFALDELVKQTGLSRVCVPYDQKLEQEVCGA